MASPKLYRAIAPWLLLAALALAPARADAAPNLGRIWLYGSATAQLSPHWSLTMMPGIRFEVARTQEKVDAFGHYMDEFFIGPNYHHRFGNLSMTLSVWYYFAGFDIIEDKYVATHNLEFVPVFNYRLGPVILTSRSIFHNILYSGLYEGPASARRGYSLVVRQLFQLGIRVHPKLTLLVASEPFFCLVEDADAKPSYLGFWRSGFRIHRLYGGVALPLGKGLTLVPQWIYEVLLEDGEKDNGVLHHGHYLFVVLSYRFRLFG